MDFVFEMPEGMLKECSDGGIVERFSYDTYTYEEQNEPLH